MPEKIQFLLRYYHQPENTTWGRMTPTWLPVAHAWPHIIDLFLWDIE